MIITLPYVPRAWQRECHKRWQRFNVLVLHRRAGKTEMALRVLVHWASKCSVDLGMFAYIAPFLNQARAIAWTRLKYLLQPVLLAGLVDIHEQTGSVVFRHNDATIRIFGADNADALRGIRLDGAVLDEVAQIGPTVWTSVVQPALADRLGWALFIGTPNGVDLFSELYFGGVGRADWYVGRWTVYETDTLDPTEVERLRAETPENEFAREFLCDFNAGAADQLLSLTDVDVASKRAVVPRDVEGAPKVLGVDVARFGDDRSVLVKRQGLWMGPPIAMAGADNMTVAAKLAQVIQEWGPDAVFVDAGAGSGVIDRCRQMGHRIVEVAFGGQAIDKVQHVNRRTEMWCTMADWVRSGGGLFDDVTLKVELATPKYKFNATGQKVLESKDDIKKRLAGGRSPDLGDALALTFAAPVQARSAAQPRSTSVSARSYDPYASWR